MPLTIENVLQYQSLKGANVITKNIGFSNEVSGAIVMEALDIEDWGRPGLLLFTSYFAFEDVSQERIDLFFHQAKEIGIAGIIIKMDRLLTTIPDFFVNSCNAYEIPLIKIGKQILYEKVLNEILESIINRDAFLLQTYYDIHQHFTKLMMGQTGIEQILENLEEFVRHPISLYEKVDQRVIGTNPLYNDFKIVSQIPALQNQHRSIQYRQYAITYPNPTLSGENKALAFIVPTLGYEEYELFIHLLDKELKDIDLVAIENAVVALQTELVKQYALRQHNRSRFNEMASDLLHGRFSNPEEIKETITDLNLDVDTNYRIIIFSFENDEHDDNGRLASRFNDTLVNHSKIEFPQLLYVTRKDKVILITPIKQLPLSDVKRKVQTLLKKVSHNKDFEPFTIYTSISNEVPIDHISEGYRQAFDTQKILQMIQEPDVVATYQDMGIYQIFVETGNLHSLDRFVPELIWDLKENHPELLDTLRTFMDVNQNYSETAQILFVHPKTVRYRVDRLKEIYDIDFQNPEQILQLSIAIRLLRLLPDRKK